LVKMWKLTNRMAPRIPAALCSVPNQSPHMVRVSSASTQSNSFVMNMFLGKVDTTQIIPYPNALNEDQEEFLSELIDPFDKFLSEVNDPAKNDELAEIEEHTYEGLKEMGAFGIQVPEEMNGLGLNNTQYARLAEIVGRHDLGVGIAIGAHQSIGFKGILLDGNQEQKEKYLPRLATGEILAAFCLTESTSGSDAASIQTRAEKSECGGHYILNGGKIWISNGGIAEIFTVFAKMKMTKEDGTEVDKISAFIVERSFGGVTNGPPEKKMGIKGSNTAEVYFDNVKIPAENLLGQEGEGFKVAMNILNNGRFGMGASLSGTMRAMIEKAADHVATRTQFGSKLHEYQGIKEKLAQMMIRHYVTESMAYIICGSMDSGFKDFQMEAAVSKIFASEAAWYVTDETIQILGGMGYMKDCGVERVLRDLRIFRIFEGTNDILRLFLALTGMQFYGKTMAAVTKAMKSPLTNLPTLLSFGNSYVTRRIKHKLGMPFDTTLVEKSHDDVKNSAKLTSHAVAAFSLVVEDFAIKHGKKFIHMQSHQNLLANSVIDIFGMVAVLSRASKALSEGTAGAQHEADMCNIWCNDAYKRVQDNLAKCEDAASGKDFKKMASLSESLVESQALLSAHPLRL